jgi:hypothetical protein
VVLDPACFRVTQSAGSKEMFRSCDLCIHVFVSVSVYSVSVCVCMCVCVFMCVCVYSSVCVCYYVDERERCFVHALLKSVQFRM